MPRIFISYRRDDSKDFTDLFTIKLTEHIPKRDIFLDISDIPLGVKFPDHIEKIITKIDVMLVMIGNHWQKILDERKDDDQDILRLEVEKALELDIVVIPVLINGAQMPTSKTLPKSIEGLAIRNGFKVNRESLDDDVHRLADGINKSVALKQREVRYDKITMLQAHQALQATRMEGLSDYSHPHPDGHLYGVGHNLEGLSVYKVEVNKITLKLDMASVLSFWDDTIRMEWLEQEFSAQLGTEVKVTFHYDELIDLDDLEDSESSSKNPQDLDDIPF